MDAEWRLRSFGLSAEWERVAITREQVAQYNLPSSYGERGVEAEAMPAETLRGIVRAAIERFVDADAVAVLRTVEEEERVGLHRLMYRAAADEDDE